MFQSKVLNTLHALRTQDSLRNPKKKKLVIFLITIYLYPTQTLTTFVIKLYTLIIIHFIRVFPN